MKFASSFFPKILRGFSKLTYERWRYGRGKDYDAEQYWRDRFIKYGRSLCGPGHEGLSLEENEAMYAEASETLFHLADQLGIDWPTARVLEVGLGNGYYTRLLKINGVRKYLGVDIVDVNFDFLRRVDDAFRFEKLDVTTENITGEFDVILTIDVIQHIVVQSKLQAFLRSLRACMAMNSILFINPLFANTQKRLYYLASWSKDEILSAFPGCSVSPLIPFRDENIVIVREGQHELSKLVTGRD